MRKTLGLAFAVILAAGPASAATITVGGNVLNPIGTTNSNSNFGSEAEICAGFGSADPSCLAGSDPYSLLYKANVGGSDQGTLAGSYTTTFTVDGEGEAIGGTISYDGFPDPYATCPNCYLIVKDGSATPAQYLFSLNTWDGTSTITLTDFWVGVPGAISNVAIWGSEEPTDPGDPSPDGGATLSLLGGALVGLGILRRKFQA